MHTDNPISWRNRRVRDFGKQFKTITVEGTFIRYGGDIRRRLSNGRTRLNSTALFLGVTNTKGETLADHLWVKNMGALNGLECGQQVRFTGRVKHYTVRFKDEITGLDSRVTRKTIFDIHDVEVIGE